MLSIEQMEEMSPSQTDDGAPEEDKQPAPAPSPTQPASQVKYYASIYPGMDKEIPLKLGQAARRLEQALNMPLWFLLHRPSERRDDYNEINGYLYRAFLSAKADLPENKPIALLIDSPGGYAKTAYQLAMLFRYRCGGFTTIVPRYAKSAATLLSLGADIIIMGEYAELGPLDVQRYDPERENVTSALDEVKSLHSLHAFAMESLDESMTFLASRTGKKIDTLLPYMLKFITDIPSTAEDCGFQR